MPQLIKNLFFFFFLIRAGPLFKAYMLGCCACAVLKETVKSIERGIKANRSVIKKCKRRLKADRRGTSSVSEHTHSTLEGFMSAVCVLTH